VSNVERLRSLGYPAHRGTPGEAGRIAGGLRIPATVTAVAHFPGEGHVLPGLFLAGLLSDAKRHGTRFAPDEAVGIDDGPGGVSVALAGDGIVRGGRSHRRRLRFGPLPRLLPRDAQRDHAGPLLGRLAAAEITTGREQDLLRPFRPTRFIGVRRGDVQVDQRATAPGDQ
jgi:glycine/D-amino acid oxidase-like deaminating enzyme